MTTVKFIQLTENFDSRKLNFIVNNGDSEAVKTVLGKHAEGRSIDYKNILKTAKKYLEYSRHGLALCTYKQRCVLGKKGRWFVCGGRGLQGITRPIRHTIAGHLYDDIDVKNCHPVLLAQICKSMNIECPHLESYINNREERLNEVEGKTPDQIKQIYISLMNGGEADYRKLVNAPQSMQDFRRECLDIHDKIANKNAENFADYEIIYNTERPKGFDNAKGSFTNKHVEELENKVLMCIYDTLNRPEDCVLCFDGLMIRKDTLYDLVACERAVKKTLNIDIQLTVKPMNTNAIVVPDNYPDYQYKPLRWFKDYKNIRTTEETVISELHVREWALNTFAWINNIGSGYYIALDEGTDAVTGSTDRKYKILDEDEIKKSLKVYCNIANDKFDKDYFAVWNHRGGQKAIQAKKDPRFHRVLYSKLCDYILYLRSIGKIPTYDRAEFVPYLKSQHGGKAPDFKGEVFNLFQGYPLEDASPCPDIDFTKTKTYAFIRDDICAERMDEFENLNETIADMIQNAVRLSGVSHLFYSMQGGGKSTFARFMSVLLGKQHTVSIIRHDRYLYNSFNSTTTLKILKVFEELPEKKSIGSGHSIVKGETTQEDEVIEHKGKDPFVVRNYARIWSFTNWENALFIENSDRRNILHRCSNKHANDKKYFAAINIELDDPRIMKAAFDYYATLGYDRMEIMTAIDTDYKREQKISCMPSALKFLKGFIEEKYNSSRLHAEDYNADLAANIDYRYPVKILADDFKAEYNGTKQTMETQFKHLQMNHHRDRNHVTSGAVQCYAVYPPDIEKRFKEYLRDPTFKFDYGEVDDPLLIPNQNENEGGGEDDALPPSNQNENKEEEVEESSQPAGGEEGKEEEFDEFDDLQD